MPKNNTARKPATKNNEIVTQTTLEQERDREITERETEETTKHIHDLDPVQGLVADAMNVNPETVEEIIKQSEPPPEHGIMESMGVLQANHKTKSGIIRYLHSQGHPTKNITKFMRETYPDFLYQHARNVITNPLKRPSTTK
jgi:hypothetical protein